MRISKSCVAVATVSVAVNALAQDAAPSAGFVPTAEVAVKIAEAVAVPVFGAEVVASEFPLQASLEKGEWFVVGTDNSRDTFGGVLEIRISKKDGRILSVSHGE